MNIHFTKHNDKFWEVGLSVEMRWHGYGHMTRRGYVAAIMSSSLLTSREKFPFSLSGTRL